MGPIKEGPEFNNAARSIEKSELPTDDLSVIRGGGIG